MLVFPFSVQRSPFRVQRKRGGNLSAYRRWAVSASFIVLVLVLVIELAFRSALGTQSSEFGGRGAETCRRVGDGAYRLLSSCSCSSSSSIASPTDQQTDHDVGRARSRCLNLLLIGSDQQSKIEHEHDND